MCSLLLPTAPSLSVVRKSECRTFIDHKSVHVVPLGWQSKAPSDIFMHIADGLAMQQEITNVSIDWSRTLERTITFLIDSWVFPRVDKRSISMQDHREKCKAGLPGAAYQQQPLWTKTEAYQRSKRAYPDSLRINLAEREMMRHAKITRPLKKRTGLPKRTDQFMWGRPSTLRNVSQ
ncbi:uncharacterized protein BYT42DRAFT_562197 [Radiomyces spectabilis]|uniref:uncharacterized protein n=1 Tax=Radiomyces spectabilis TaxID=64574 RepID=UPI00221EDB09|nr:uncharacterized protein BYT42DRAFT_562197 [Radiomyces spectabilis]KAI8384346.1 hypothetical protein BYT42DRAFT_562197 [Radiomyces spectabilis]